MMSSMFHGDERKTAKTEEDPLLQEGLSGGSSTTSANTGDGDGDGPGAGNGSINTATEFSVEDWLNEINGSVEVIVDSFGGDQIPNKVVNEEMALFRNNIKDVENLPPELSEKSIQSYWRSLCSNQCGLGLVTPFFALLVYLNTVIKPDHRPEQAAEILGFISASLALVGGLNGFFSLQDTNIQTRANGTIGNVACNLALATYKEQQMIGRNVLQLQKDVGTIFRLSNDLNRSIKRIEEKLEKMATKDDISRIEERMATKDDISRIEERMVTQDDISRIEERMVTQDDIRGMATQEDIGNLAGLLVTILQRLPNPNA